LEINTKSLSNIEKFFEKYFESVDFDLGRRVQRCLGLEEDFFIWYHDRETDNYYAVVLHEQDVEDAIKRLRRCRSIPKEYKDKIKVVDYHTYLNEIDKSEEILDKLECEENEDVEECYIKYTREDVQKMQMEIPLEEFITLINSENEVWAEDIKRYAEEGRLIGIYLALTVVEDPFEEVFTNLVALPQDYANKEVCYLGVGFNRKKKKNKKIIEVVSAFRGSGYVDDNGVIQVNEEFEPPEYVAIAVAFYTC